MSQTLVISTSGKIPDSTTVKAYLPGQVPERNRAPIGEKVAEAETSSGSLTLTALPDNADLILAYEAESVWHYPMRVTTPAASNTGGNEIASANTITLPNGRVIKVTGTTEIKKIVAAAAGTIVILYFAASCKLVKGENLKISATYEATADDTIALACDGTNWREFGRAVV
jgi:hypothetical protein